MISIPELREVLDHSVDMIVINLFILYDFYNNLYEYVKLLSKLYNFFLLFIKMYHNRSYGRYTL